MAYQRGYNFADNNPIMSKTSNGATVEVFDVRGDKHIMGRVTMPNGAKFEHLIPRDMIPADPRDFTDEQARAIGDAVKAPGFTPPPGLVNEPVK